MPKVGSFAKKSKDAMRALVRGNDGAQKGDVSCPAFEFIYIYFSVVLFMCFRPCSNG